MTKYEIMFIVKSTIEDEVAKNVVTDIKEIFTKNKAEVIEFKEIGKKQLAYPIKKEVSGAYYLMYVLATPEVINEFDRRTLINDNVLRHLIIKEEKGE